MWPASSIKRKNLLVLCNVHPTFGPNFISWGKSFKFQSNKYFLGGGDLEEGIVIRATIWVGGTMDVRKLLADYTNDIATKSSIKLYHKNIQRWDTTSKTCFPCTQRNISATKFREITIIIFNQCEAFLVLKYPGIFQVEIHSKFAPEIMIALNWGVGTP